MKIENSKNTQPVMCHPWTEEQSQCFMSITFHQNSEMLEIKVAEKRETERTNDGVM